RLPQTITTVYVEDPAEGAPALSGIEVLLKGAGLEGAASRQDVLDILAANNAALDSATGSLTLGGGWVETEGRTGAGGTETRVWQHGEGGDALVLEAAPAVEPKSVGADDGSIEAVVLVLNTTSV
ncbi:MAG: hypothetical protein Q4F72_13040, partial [Desulfovibrionaceae bacterium]|nr:hypothetical protein [Desulfovibrionaceae bacterium]